ncbi:serine protease [Actinacidiphila sp. bgisy145]|uniref:serine protease n=1 Tax=Actinacidiphila sp. bgisy145 TaxID=3413792 RepID=UPI003EC0EBDD
MTVVRGGGRTRGRGGHIGEQAGGRTGARDGVRDGAPGGTGSGAGGGPGGAGSLIRVCDLAGRPRGTGFLADREGTLITSHEAVDGLARLVLHAPGDQVCLVEAEAVTPLPGCGLALVATEGLDVRPLPIAPPGSGAGHRDRRAVLRLPQPAAATVLGTTSVTYTATDRFHLLEGVHELALDGADLAAAGPQASGTPVVDAATGAVLAVVVTALHSGHRAGGFAVPLHPGAAPAPLAELIVRAAATVPAYGAHLNLAGALRLADASVDAAAGAGEPCREAVPRPGIAAALDHFLSRRGEAAPLAAGLVGEPGTGRSTELAALAARRREAADPAPTVWVRGAELRPGDGSVKDAVERALRAAARVVGPDGHTPGRPLPAPLAYGAADPAEEVAALARAAGRPLVVLLDAPEEMPPVLAHELAGWIAATAGWLRTSRARLVVACRPEFWEQAGALLPAELVHEPRAGAGAGAGAGDGEGEPGVPVRPLPPCVRVGDLDGAEAAEARARHGLPEGALRAKDAGHVLALRLLSQVRAEIGPRVAPAPAPSRAEVFAAHLDAACLRIAVRLGAAAPDAPPVRGRGLRRLAARVAGQTHEAARRCLGPGQGELDREAFEELFPWRTGWASAVLAEGLLVPAGAGYRFAHEEFGDWVQSLHLDLPTALNALVHRWSPAAGHSVPPLVPGDAPVRLPSRTAGRFGGTGGPGLTPGAPPVPPAPAVGPSGRPRSLPVPRHRAGPVVGALLLAPPEALAEHLGALVEVLDDGRTGRPGPSWPRARQERPPVRWEPEGADLDADTVPNGRVRAAGPWTAPPRPAGAAPGAARRRAEAQWWAAHLLREALLRVEDAGPLLPVLRALAGRIVVRAIAVGGFVPEHLGALGGFGPWFWRAVPLAVPDRLELLRVLLPADGPPGQHPRQDRFLGVAAQLLREQGGAALPVVCGWFDDDRPLQAAHPFTVGGRLTVASAAQALLHTHSRRAPDALTEALVDAGHPGADAVLAALAEDHPGAICRAVDRWAHDPRPARRVAAATYGARVARFARGPADRELLRYAALALLARADETGLHGAALGVLVRDLPTRVRYLPAALRGFAAGDPGLSPDALVEAMDTHPEMVLDAFRTRLRAVDGETGAKAAIGGARPAGVLGPVGAVEGRAAARAAEVLAALAAVREPVLARRAAVLVQDHLRQHPEAAPDVARYLDLRLEHGPGARPLLLSVTAELLREHPAPVRAVLLPVFATPGTHLSQPLRHELLDAALETERDPDVLAALLAAAARAAPTQHPLLTRDLVHRLAMLLTRTPEGAVRFDRTVVALAAEHPPFAHLLRTWLTDVTWDTLLGPSARHDLLVAS